MSILMKRILKVTFWILFIAFDIVGLMAISNVKENGQYTVDARKFDTVIEWGDGISLGDIKIIDNRIFGLVETTLTEDMIVEITDTSTAGEKKVIFEHNNKRFEVVFTVKYKVEFLVNGEVVNTQLVVSSDELVFPNPMPEHGYEFVRWDYDFSRGISGNLQVNAVFAELEFPRLSDITATYGDTLGDFTLPSNNRGRWEFLDPATTSVGDVGRHSFLVGYRFNGQSDYYEYDTVEIEVLKKNLEFHIDKESFTYDTKSHFPAYTLDVDGLEVISTGSSQTLPGVYTYSFEIIDPNYSGEYIGSFEIVRPDVTVTVSSATMTYLDEVPEFTYTVEGFDNTDNVLGITLTNLPTSSTKAGEYEIGATCADKNVNLTVVAGKLTVLKADRPVNVPTLSTVTYEDKLSDVEFVGNYLGTWAWEDPDIIVDNMSGITAWAIFTHNDPSLNTVRMQITITGIQKKELTINIIESKFTYSPDTGYTLVYEIVGGRYPELYKTLTVDGNGEETEVGSYFRTLYINDERYTATVSHYLEIEQATPDTDFTKLYERDWSEGLKLGSITLPDGYTWDDPDKIITAGEHTVYMTFTPDDTHNYKTVTETITVKVAKIEVDIEGVRDSYDKSYDTTKIDIKNSGIRPLYTDGDFSITYYKDGVEVDEIKNAGTYTVIIKVTEGTNYLEKTIEKTVIISPKANPETVSTSQSVYYNSDMSALKLPDGIEGEWSWRETEIGEVGTKTFVAIYTPDANGNYLPREVEVSVEVKKISITAPNILDTKYTGEGFEYDTGAADTDEYTVSGDIVVTSAGNFSVTFTLRDPAHYEWFGDTDKVSVTKSYKVSTAPNSWKTEPENISVEFTGNPVYMLNAEATHGNKNDITVVYTLNGEVVDAPIYVGVYKVTITAVADNYDDLVAERTIEIKKQSVPVPQPPVGGLVYNGTAQSVPLDSNLNVLYTKSNEVKGTNVGDQPSVVLTLIDSDNYKWSTSEEASVTVTTEIAKHTVSFTGAPTASKSEWTYLDEEGTFTNATLDEVSIALGITAELRFSYNGGSAVTFDQLARTNSKLNAGTYEVWSVVIGTPNWDETHSTSVKFVVKQISKYTISVSWPDAVAGDDGLYYQNLLGTPEYTVTYKGESVSLSAPCTFDISADGFAGADTKLTFTVYPSDTVNYAKAGVDVAVPLKTVATINLGTGFGTIEAALAAAQSGDTVWVTTDISGNVYIMGNADGTVTVPSGVTLLIPYGDVDSAEGRNMSDKATLTTKTNKFAHQNPDTYLKNKVKLSSGVTLIVNGTLNISGQITAGSGGKMAGYTAGKYAVLELEADAHIQVNGTAKCYGYIDNASGVTSGKVTVENGGNIYLPFILYDFKGGSILSAIYYDIQDGYGTSPFARFSFNTVTVDLRFNYGSQFISMNNLEADSDIHHNTGTFIGYTADAFIQLTQPGYSYIESKYDPETLITKTTIYGGASINNLSLSVDVGFTATMSSDKFVFAWSWMFDITLAANDKQLEKGEIAVYDAYSKYKLMPGAKLTVDTGSKLNVSSLSVYDNSYYDVFGTGKYPTTYPSLSSLYKGTIASATLTVRGEIVAGDLAGAVYTDVDGAKVTVTGSTKITTYEVARTEKTELFGYSTGAKVSARQKVVYSLRLVYVDADGNVIDAVSAIARGADGVHYTSNSDLQQWTTDATVNEYITVTLPAGVRATIDSVVITDEDGNIIGFESYDSSAGGVVKVVPDTPVLLHLNKQILLYNDATSYTAELYERIVATGGTYKVWWYANTTDSLHAYRVPSFSISSAIAGKVYYKDLGKTDESGNSAAYVEIILSTSNTVYKDGTLYVNVSAGWDANKCAYTYTGKEGALSKGKYTITGDDGNGTDVSITLTITLKTDVTTAFTIKTGYSEGTKDSGSGCVTPDTLITLADGTQTRVDSLKGDEMLLVWNMETGKFDFAPIMFVDSESVAEYKVVYLHFSDGSVVKVVYEHGFWDYDLNKYVYLDENAANFIGHYFAKQIGDELVKVQLVDVQIVTELTTAWSPVTAGHLCYFVNGMLSMPGGVGGLFNIFEVDRETMTYDYEAMAKDIETYGLYTYEELNAICPLSEEMFNLAGGAYLKISIGKGNLTVDELIYMIERYSVYFE